MNEILKTETEVLYQKGENCFIVQEIGTNLYVEFEKIEDAKEFMD